jgi:hypothetical protein
MKKATKPVVLLFNRGQPKSGPPLFKKQMTLKMRDKI